MEILKHFEKVHRNDIRSKSEVQRAFVFDLSKTFQKEMLKRQRFFVFQKQIKISTLNLHQFSIKITSKIHRNNVSFFVH